MVDMHEEVRRIDLQFHFAPDFYTKRVKQIGGYYTADRWSVPAALAYMQRYQVEVGIMSVSSPGVDFLESDESVSMARALNDVAAAIAIENPGRFGNFATLPMQDVAATLAEIARCFDELHMEGVCMMSNVRGLYLGHESFVPVFDELNRRRSVVVVQPTNPVAIANPKLAVVLEWPFDTTRAAVDLMYSGTVDRCPDIAFILANAGGALPMVARRVEEMSYFFSVNPSLKHLEQTTAEIANFYYDLAISAHEYAIGALREVSSLEHVLFASGWPFAPDSAIEMNTAAFEALKLTPSERYAIERGNAARLFPKLVHG